MLTMKKKIGRESERGNGVWEAHADVHMGIGHVACWKVPAVAKAAQSWAEVNALGGAGSRRLALLIGLAGACLCVYALLLSLTSNPCWHSIHCAKSMVTQRLAFRRKEGGEEASMVASPSKNYKPLDLPVQGRGFAVQAHTPGTNLSHIVFGIAASTRLWSKRKEYIKLWWRPNAMRGYVWLEEKTASGKDDEGRLPLLMVSPNTSQFRYTNKLGRRSAIRISRIVSDTFRLGLPEVHWFVMGDDDTVFVPENLVRVLSKYDHTQYYYIGSNSESHLQNLMFSYNMAYGGGGFAISYPLAKALEGMQDGCLARYPGLFGSDDRIQACMAELGVPLTKEPGFHQYDIFGNLFGLIAAHPITPAVSLHHLDVVEPIFPNVTRLRALQHLRTAMVADPAGFLQQSICYDRRKLWSVTVSWGFAVQVYRGVFTARELEMPPRTFYNWHKKADYTAYAFNTRPFSKHPCQKPFVFYMQNVTSSSSSDNHSSNGGGGGGGWTESFYRKHDVRAPDCNWKIMSPETLELVKVVKQRDESMWSKGPRRKCCRVAQSSSSSSTALHIDVRDCKPGEIAAA